MPVSIKGTGGGSVTISSGAAASDTTLTLPNVTGTLLQSGTAVTVAQGGTGVSSLTANNVLLGNGASAVQFVAPGNSGNVLTSNGTTWASTAGVNSIVAGTNVTVSGSTGAVTINATVPAQASAWTDVTGSRAFGTTYTNSTGKTITAMLSITWPVGGTGSYQVYVGSVQIAGGGGMSNYNSEFYKTVDVISFPIPAGATYRVAASGPTLTIWAEFS